VPSSRPVRPDFGQLQAQLQQRLNQQRVWNERDMSDWRPTSDCGSSAVDIQSIVPVPAPFSRYSAPPAADVLIKSGPVVHAPDRVSTVFVPSSSQHTMVTVPSSSSLSSAVVKPGQSLHAAAARPQSGMLAMSGGGSGSMMSSTAMIRHSSPTSQHARSVVLSANVAAVLLSYCSCWNPLPVMHHF